eukprot:4861802-Pyramimonas_sp.AAC.1
MKTAVKQPNDTHACMIQLVQRAQERHGHDHALGVKEQAAMNERLFHMVIRGHGGGWAVKNRVRQRHTLTDRRISTVVATLKASAFQADVATKEL